MNLQEWPTELKETLCFRFLTFPKEYHWNWQMRRQPGWSIGFGAQALQPCPQGTPAPCGEVSHPTFCKSHTLSSWIGAGKACPSAFYGGFITYQMLTKRPCKVGKACLPPAVFLSPLCSIPSLRVCTESFWNTRVTRSAQCHKIYPSRVGYRISLWPVQRQTGGKIRIWLTFLSKEKLCPIACLRE